MTAPPSSRHRPTRPTKARHLTPRAGARHRRPRTGTSDPEPPARPLEYVHGLRRLPGAWPVVRVDGGSFTRLTTTHFAKPFDPRFHELMVTTARALLEELQGVYAHTQSDEVSVLLPRATGLFDRELEKLVSL